MARSTPREQYEVFLGRKEFERIRAEAVRIERMLSTIHISGHAVPSHPRFDSNPYVDSPFPPTSHYLILSEPGVQAPSANTCNALVTLALRILPWTANVVLTEDVHDQLTDHFKSELHLMFKLFVKDLTPSTWQVSPHLEVIVVNRLSDTSLILTNILGVLNGRVQGRYRKRMLFKENIDHPTNFESVLVHLRGLPMTGQFEIYGYPVLFTGITSGRFGDSLVSSQGPHHVKICNHEYGAAPL